MRIRFAKEWTTVGGSAVLALICLLAAQPAHSAGSFPFMNRTNESAGAVSNFAQNGLYTAYTCPRSNDYQYSRAAFPPAASTTRLALHSDDGPRLVINGTTILDRYGEDQLRE
jgi:hypothetical protein